MMYFAREEMVVVSTTMWADRRYLIKIRSEVTWFKNPTLSLIRRFDPYPDQSANPKLAAQLAGCLDQNDPRTLLQKPVQKLTALCAFLIHSSCCWRDTYHTTCDWRYHNFYLSSFPIRIFLYLPFCRVHVPSFCFKNKANAMKSCAAASALLILCFSQELSQSGNILNMRENLNGSLLPQAGIRTLQQHQQHNGIPLLADVSERRACKVMMICQAV